MDMLAAFQVHIKHTGSVLHFILLYIVLITIIIIVVDSKSVCQYNEDCPPELLCDRLNRVCISPCAINKCGDNAECIPINHGIQCKCPSGFAGNPYLECYEGKNIFSILSDFSLFSFE